MGYLNMAYFLQQRYLGSRTAGQLEKVRMTESERRYARAALQRGEDFAEFAFALARGAQRLASSVRRSRVVLARGLKTLFARVRRDRAAPPRARRARRAGAA